MWGFWTLCRNDNTIGTGHIRRCLTFAKYILSKNEKVHFIINDNQYAIHLLKQNNIPYFLDEDIQEITDDFFKYLFIDVYDGFNNETLISEKHRISNITIGITDYFEYVDLKCDISIFTNESISDKNSNNNLKGAKYLIAESEFYSKRREFNGEIKNILIAFGGYDPFNVTQKVINSISHLPNRFENLKFNILIGSMYPYKEELVKYLNKSKLRFKIFINVEDIASFYYENDFVITAGGNTFYEISIMGIPSLVLSQNARQHNAITSLQSSLKMNYLGFYEGVKIETIGDELYFQIRNPEELNNNSRSCLSFFNIDGKKMIYNKIKEYEK